MVSVSVPYMYLHQIEHQIVYGFGIHTYILLLIPLYWTYICMYVYDISALRFIPKINSRQETNIEQTRIAIQRKDIG